MTPKWSRVSVVWCSGRWIPPTRTACGAPRDREPDFTYSLQTGVAICGRGFSAAASLEVPQADAAELEGRRGDPLPERQQRRDDPQLDPRCGVQREQILELDHLDGLEVGAGDPVPGRPLVARERLAPKAIRVQRRLAESLQPRALDRVDASGAVAVEEPLDVAVGRLLDGPKRPARAVPREPVRRHVLFVDRPHECLGRIMRLVRARPEAADSAVLADVPEIAHRR